VNHKHRNTTRKIAALVGLSLISMICAFAQTSQTSGTQPLLAAQPRTVPLASDACPAVRPGDKVSFEWNPGFEHSGIVVGLGNLSLHFGRLAANGVTVSPLTSFRQGGLASNLQVTAIGNGYLHVELPIPTRVAPGEYHLIKAMSVAKTLPEYQGPALSMTNSPVSARYCITVVPTTTQLLPQH